MEMPDVSVLLQSESEAEDDEHDDNKQAEEEEEEEAPQLVEADGDEVAAKDFEKWHKVMMRQVRSVKTDTSKLEASCKTMVNTMEQHLEELVSEVSLTEFAKGEISVVRRRA